MKLTPALPGLTRLGQNVDAAPETAAPGDGRAGRWKAPHPVTRRAMVYVAAQPVSGAGVAAVDGLAWVS